MVKHTHGELFEFVWPFCGIGALRVKACILEKDIRKGSSFLLQISFLKYAKLILKLKIAFEKFLISKQKLNLLDVTQNENDFMAS